MSQQEEQGYLSPEEAAALLGKTRRTLERYVDSGRIKRYRQGVRNVVFRRIDVEALKADLERVREDEDD